MVEKVAVTRELLPCPFCGGAAKVYGPYGLYRQYCISHSCKAFYAGAQDAFKDYPNRDYAIAAWNRRAPDEATRIATAEACARIAEETRTDGQDQWDGGYDSACEQIATAIRLQQGSEKP